MKNESIIGTRKIAAELVQKVLNGDLSVAEARYKWPACGKYPSGDDKLMVNVFRILEHWRDDDDIRSKDERYAEWQKNEFKNMIKELMSPNNKK